MSRLKRSMPLALALLIVQGTAAGKTNFRKWLAEEVVWIISEKETQAFQNLKADVERERFIEEFWRRRDPTPDTPRNEYKEEHYRRYQYALKNFQEGLPGWKTDRGRVYILHGPPDNEDFHNSDSRAGRDGRSDSSHVRTPNTIVWTYHRLPPGKHYKGGELSLVFQPSAGMSRLNFALDESRAAQERADELWRLFGPAADQTFLEADVRYRLIVAGPPGSVNPRGMESPSAGQGESARYLQDILRSPGDVLEERLKLEGETARARDDLRESIKARLSFGDLPLTVSTQSFIQGRDYSVQVRVEIPYNDLVGRLFEPGREKSQIHVYCALTDPEDRVIDEFLDSAELVRPAGKQDNAGSLNYLNAFTVRPGTYRLRAAVRSVDGARLGYREESLELGDGPRQQLEISSLMITNRVAQAASDMEAGSVGIILGDVRILPSVGNTFSPADNLVVYFQVLLPRDVTAGSDNLSLAMNFIREENIARSLSPRAIRPTNSGTPEIIDFATAVPLTGFEPGAYVLQVQVIDHDRRKFAFRRASFEIR